MLQYEIKARKIKGELAFAEANGAKVLFETAVERVEDLPNPAELLLCSLAACMLKNVERFSGMIHFDYEEAQIEIKGVRNDAPPMMAEIHYALKIKSGMDERKLSLLHKNILKYGTITNTLARCTKLNGTIELI